MAQDPRYIPAFSIETVMLDKDSGAPLSGGEVLFEIANQPGVMKPVYQITYTSGIYSYIQLPNPMTLSAIGTFEDSLGNPVIPYFFPFTEDEEEDEQLYRITVTSSGGVNQFTRDPQPYVSSDLDPSDTAVDYTNELENPQFAEILFDGTGTTFSFTDAALEEIEIAPGWTMVVSNTGTGTVTLTQFTPTGSDNLPTNPPTLLTITSDATISLLQIRQRMYGSPNLFGGGYLSGTLVGKTNTGSQVIVMNYKQSGSSTVTPIMEDVTLISTYDVYSKNALMPSSVSADTYPDAYIDIYLTIPVETTITITSVQVVATGAISVDEVPYAQDSLERQTDFLFNYYQPELNFKAIPSMLTGWDFPLNPRQFGSSTTVTTSAAYKLDQTIMASATGNVALTQDTATGAITLVNASAGEAVYVLQYLSGAEAKKILGTTLSVNIQSSSLQSNVVARAYLYRGNAASSFPTLGTTIGTIANTGVFTRTAANWTEIPRGNLGDAQNSVGVFSTAASLNNTNIDIGFSGWELTDATEISDTNKFAIVVTFQIPTITSTILLQSISLVPGEIPTRPAPMTLQETLDDCQYYYRRSFFPGVAPASSVALNNGETLMGQFKGSGVPNSLGMIVQWDKPMISTPAAIIFTPVTTGNQIYNITQATAWTACSVTATDRSGFYVIGTTVTGSAVGDVNALNWTADARIGV